MGRKGIEINGKHYNPLRCSDTAGREGEATREVKEGEATREVKGSRSVESSDGSGRSSASPGTSGSSKKQGVLLLMGRTANVFPRDDDATFPGGER